MTVIKLDEKYKNIFPLVDKESIKKGLDRNLRLTDYYKELNGTFPYGKEKIVIGVGKTNVLLGAY